MDATRLLAVIEAQNAMIAAGLDADAVLDAVVQRAHALTGVAGATVELADGSDIVCAAAAGTGTALLGTRVRRPGTLSGRCVQECGPVRSDDRTAMCVPISVHDDVVGALKLLAEAPGAFAPDDEQLLEILAGVIGAHLQATRSERGAREDALTGLWNGRALEERLGQEVARINRYGGTLSVVILSLEHAGGDDAVRFAAHCLRDLRGSDVAFRLDGDELVLLLPETDAAGAAVVARRFQETLGIDGRVRARWGACEAAPGLSGMELLGMARAAMAREPGGVSA